MLPDKHAEGGGRLQLPTGPLALLGALALFGLMAEGSATDWSGVYLQRTMNASEGVAGLAVTTFTGSMAVARLSGDRLASSWAPPGSSAAVRRSRPRDSAWPWRSRFRPSRSSGSA